MRQLSPAEVEIQKSLTKQVDVRFTDRPLSEVMETLGALASINIHLDPAGLAAEGITPSTPVTLNLAQPISLKSVLMLILQPLRLGYVIDNEVLMISSEQAKDSKVFPKVYYVADLVVPIPNFVPGYDMGLPAAISEAHHALGFGGGMMLGFWLPRTAEAAVAPLASEPSIRLLERVREMIQDATQKGERLSAAGEHE